MHHLCSRGDSSLFDKNNDDRFQAFFDFTFLHSATRELIIASHRARPPKNAKENRTTHNAVWYYSLRHGYNRLPLWPRNTVITKRRSARYFLEEEVRWWLYVLLPSPRLSCTQAQIYTGVYMKKQDRI
jgi:hypothetical protein